MALGLALGGGGAKGAAHVGVLTALEECGIYPTSLSGTSSGSIVAGLYASGLTPKQLKEVVKEFNDNGKKYIDLDVLSIISSIPNLFFKKQFTLKGFIKGDKLENYIDQLTNNVNINDVRLKLIIPTVDLLTGKTIVYCNYISNNEKNDLVEWRDNIKLSKAIRGSISVPAVFVPREVDNTYLVDGGVTNNLPVDLLISSGTDTVIAVDISKENPLPESINLIDISYRSYSIMNTYLKEMTSTGEKILLKPPIPQKAGLLTFEYMNDCMEAAYDYTMKMMPRIKSSI